MRRAANVVGGGVIERGEQREIFGDVVGLAADIFGEFEDDFSWVAQDDCVGCRAGIAARGAVDIGDVDSRGRRRGMRIGKKARAGGNREDLSFHWRKRPGRRAARRSAAAAAEAGAAGSM